MNIYVIRNNQRFGAYVLYVVNGIAGNFLSFGHLYSKYRRGLYVLALCVPAIVYGLYDSLANYLIVSLVMVFLGLMLLMVYLKQSADYQSKLRL